MKASLMRTLVLLGCATLLAPVSLSAQVLEPPARGFRGLFGPGRPPDPNRASHELSLTTSILGGYDDVFSPTGGGGPEDLFRVRQSASTGSLDVAARYRRTKDTRSFSLFGRSYGNAYGISAYPTYGGDIESQLETNVGRRNRLEARQAVRFEPVLSITGLGFLDAGVEESLLPSANPATAVLEQSSRRVESAVSLARTWTRRQTSSVTAHFATYDRLADEGSGAGSSRTGGGSAEYGWSLTRHGRLLSTYRYTQVRGLDASDQWLRSISQSIEGGYEYERPLSRTRDVQFSVGVGAARLRVPGLDQEDPVDYWAPAGHGAVGVDIGRTWTARGIFSRGLTVLEGVSNTSFYANAMALQFGGLVGRRLDATMTAGLASGKTATPGDEVGRYQTYSGMTQLRWALKQCCAAVVSYNYYHYRLTGISLAQGFPTSMNRHAVRVGFSIWLPLYGVVTEGENRERR